LSTRAFTSAMENAPAIDPELDNDVVVARPAPASPSE
jgi:hypothetical protein